VGRPVTAGDLRLDDRHHIVAVSLGYAAGIDHRDWARYRDCFTDVCEFDFSSWSGRPAGPMSADDWVAAVRRVNGAFDATQHLMSNHDVCFDGPDEAVGVNELQAQHWYSAESMARFGRPAEPAWCLLGGHYTNRYVRSGDDGRWRITACTLTVRWHTGDRTIFTLP
jgi:hypothetical protein